MWKVVLYINTVSFEAPIECTHSRMKQDRIGDDESCSGENKKTSKKARILVQEVVHCFVITVLSL